MYIYIIKANFKSNDSKETLVFNKNSTLKFYIVKIKSFS